MTIRYLAFLVGLTLAALLSTGLEVRASDAAGMNASASPIQEPNEPAAPQWKLITSHDTVEASLSPPLGTHLPLGSQTGFTLEYNFTKGSGFAIAQLPFLTHQSLPENYEVSFTLAGNGPSNDLEVKLLDAGDGTHSKLGESVWWVKRRNFEWPTEPARIINKTKHFQFAWGPLNGAKIKKLGGIEIVVASSSGGHGTITVTDIRIRELPAPSPYTGTPKAAATSEKDGHPAAASLDSDSGTRWIAKEDDASPALTIDFGQLRDFDGLRIDWVSPVQEFAIETSDNQQAWRRVWRGTSRGVKTSFVDLPDTTARYARVTLTRVGDQLHNGVGATGVRVLQLPEGETLGIWRSISRDLLPSAFPRYFTGRQSSWTVLGAPTGTEESLINEQGTVELWRSGASLEPVVTNEAGRVVPWTSAKPPTMLDHGLPIAQIELSSSAYVVTVTAFVDGPPDDATLLTRYEVRSRAAERASADRFHLLLRPFQVNPPWQFLNNVGGVARIKSISHDAGAAGSTPRWCDLVCNDKHRVQFPLLEGATTRLFSFDDGEAGVRLAKPDAFPDTPAQSSVFDARAAASADWSVPLSLHGSETAVFVIASPLNKRERATLPGIDAAVVTPEHFAARLAAAKIAWERLVSRATVKLPPGKTNDRLSDSLRASLAYILINRDGPGFQPGSRSYERSWIRDGALTSAALLEFGMTEEVRQFIDWYAGHQFPSGGIPCVVDVRGADPVVENDSHGQFIYALAEYYRHTGDATFLLKHFDAVNQTVAHIETERNKRKTAEYSSDKTHTEPGKPPVPLRAFYGLMPESISHEGYSSKPMHSYWDDFFTYKGLCDAATIARVLNKDDQDKTWTLASQDLLACIEDSIKLAQSSHKIGYIPGCPELGDFDATSTTIAINPCGALNDIPRAWYDATFEKWWEFFTARRDGAAKWIDYTPYEWRIVGSQVMLGQRERAWASLEWYMRDQLPPPSLSDAGGTGWLHWAEIVHADRAAGKWIGDMPHTWVASDFLRSVRTMLVYEQPAQGRPGVSDLVLFAGVPEVWMNSEEGVTITDIGTHAGPITAHLRGAGEQVELAYSGLPNLRGKVFLRPPLEPITNVELLEGEIIKEQDGTYSSTSKSLKIRFH